MTDRLDRLFSLALLLCVLAGGTAAIGSELFARPQAPAATVVQLPRVVVTGRIAAAQPEATVRVASTQPAGSAPAQ